MDEEINPTTRCFPRTLLEARPYDYHSYIEEPEETIGTWDICVIAAAVMLWVFAVYCWSVS